MVLEKTKKDLPVTATMGNSTPWRLLMQCYAELKKLTDAKLIKSDVNFDNIGAPDGDNVIQFHSPALNDEDGNPMEFHVGIDNASVVGYLVWSGKTMDIDEPNDILHWAGLL